MDNDLSLDFNLENNPSMTFELYYNYNFRGCNSVRFPKAGLKINKEGIVTDGATFSNQITPDQILLQETIGKGVSSYVCKGTYMPYNIPIALKIINIFDQEKRHQLLNDLRTFLTGYNCENLVKFYGAYYEEGTIRILLEMMDQGSLRNIISQVHQKCPQIMNEYLIATIVHEILIGLTYLHQEKHQLHRDIKPENVLINSQGEIKLTDFGISKQLDNTMAIAQTFVGTLIYMSPERSKGTGYSFSSDLWSLGLVVYELACGQHPFVIDKQTTYIKMIQSIIKSDSPQLVGNYSEELKDFLRICLNKDQTKRMDARSLLQHPWILKFKQNRQYIQQWLAQKDQLIS